MDIIESSGGKNLASVTDTAIATPDPLERTPSRATVTTIDTVNDLNYHPSCAGSTKALGLKWHNEYDEASKLRPRVLMIEYHWKDVTQQVRRVTAREFKELEELRGVYQTERSDDTILRVFHVQNCSWGEHYLMRKHAFGVHTPGLHTSSGNISMGSRDFGRWVNERKPPRCLGKLMMSSGAWTTHSDPWRGVAKTAFGMDYMKDYPCGVDRGRGEKQLWEGEKKKFFFGADKVLDLQGLDGNDSVTHAYNVNSQRLSVYVQYKHRTPPIPDPDLVCPYGNNPETITRRYDNGNTILIIDNSHTNCIYDTLIPAREQLESKWRLLPFTAAAPFGGIEVDTEAHINMHYMKGIVQDIFKAVVEAWEKVLEVSREHVSILEDAIYEQPADESRASELWRNSAFWNRYEKLMFYHVDTMNDMREYLGELVDVAEDSGSETGEGGNAGVGEKAAWLEGLPEDFEKLGKLIDDDLVKPTASLSELMYRSVAFRDSRTSIQLGSSMWRLSWITFIFLPATFIVGFFGMNVETFAGGAPPDIKWFFIVLFPFFAVVIIEWYILKHEDAENRRTPVQRSLYGALYTHLERQNPLLWTRQGPQEYVVPADWVSRVKWRLIKYWVKGVVEPGEVKWWLMKKWTKEIKVVGVGNGTKGQEGFELEEAMTVENPNAGRVVPMGRVIVTDEDGKGAAVVEQRVEGGSSAEGSPTSGNVGIGTGAARGG